MLSSPTKAVSLATLIGFVHTTIPVALAGAAGAHRHSQLHARQHAPSGSSQGCFSSAGGGRTGGTYDPYQSSLSCEKTCSGYPVMALQGLYCYCANLLPSSTSVVSESQCNEICGGYGTEPCGGANAFTVWLTGLDDSVGSVSPSNSASSSSVSSTSTSSSTKTPVPTPHHKSPAGGTHNHNGNGQVPGTTSQDQSTVTKTQTQPGSTKSPDAQSGSTSSSSSTGSTIGIAVGVVAGIVALAALVTIILFYLRRRRRMKNAENGHRRADSLNAFVASGARTPGSLAGKIPPVSMNDARLDPRILQDTRRASAGSFLADNEDYSRRILKVTNPDGT